MQIKFKNVNNKTTLYKCCILINISNVHTVVAVIIDPVRISVNMVKNKILLSVNNMNPRKTLRINMDFFTERISYARAAFTTAWKGISHAYIFMTWK